MLLYMGFRRKNGGDSRQTDNFILHLYNGEQFENLKSQTISSNNVPYRRETLQRETYHYRI